MYPKKFFNLETLREWGWRGLLLQWPSGRSAIFFIGQDHPEDHYKRGLSDEKLYWRTKEIDNPLLVVPFQEISNGEHHEGKKISTANKKILVGEPFAVKRKIL